jgi:hypothetical protein
MSSLVGRFRQMAMVVRDVDATMKEWVATLGVGPFFVVRGFQVQDYFYRGQQLPGPLLTLCFAQTGAVQIELIQQHNDAPSAYRDFLESGREGVQHVCAWFESDAAYSAKRAELLSRNMTLVHEGASSTPISRFAYFETALPGGLMLEISEALTPSIRPFTDMITQASHRWDGLQPIRDITSV